MKQNFYPEISEALGDTEAGITRQDDGGASTKLSVGQPCCFLTYLKNNLICAFA